MDIIILVLLIFVSLILMYLIFKSNSASGSIEANDLMNFSNSLNSQIQDIRKEISSNSKESRNEIEAKLNTINKQINDFHKSSSESIQSNLKSQIRL